MHGQTGVQSVLQYRSPEGVEYRSLPDTDAVKSARTALEANPRNTARIIDLGVAQSGARQFREAITTFTRGLEIEPTNALLLRWRGHRYISVRELDRAFADLTRGSAINSADLWDLVPPWCGPVPARKLCRGGRIVRQGPADCARRRRIGGVHGLVVDVAQPSRPRRRSEGDAQSAAGFEACDQRVTGACSSIVARLAPKPWSRRRLPTTCRSPRSPTAWGTGTSCAATRRRRAVGSSDQSSLAVGPRSDSSCRR